MPDTADRICLTTFAKAPGLRHRTLLASLRTTTCEARRLTEKAIDRLRHCRDLEHSGEASPQRHQVKQNASEVIDTRAEDGREQSRIFVIHGR